MRAAILMGIAVFAFAVLAAAVGRVIRVVNLFAPSSAGESASVASAARYKDGPVTRSPAVPSEVVQPSAKEVSVDLDEAIGTGHGTGVQTNREELRRALPRGAIDQDVGPVMARMKLDSAGPGAEVEDLAQKIAPTLAREALEHSADDTSRNADVEHELLETWKEQKQILAGHRTTVDSVLQETPQ
jgi:hypothetical protein